MQSSLEFRSARHSRLAAHRTYLFEVASTIEFPASQQLHPVTGQPCLDQVGRAELQRMFIVFGITQLDPDDDFDLVLNTWVVLGSVASHLKSRFLFGEEVHQMRLEHWGKVYNAYLDAVWHGNSRRVAAAAEELGITAGIPEDSPELCVR